MEPDTGQEKTDEMASMIRDLSPTSQAAAKQMLESLRRKEAKFVKDEQGRSIIQYKDGISRNAWRDPFYANTIARPKSDEDCKSKCNAFLKNIEYMKKNVPPSGIVLDPTYVNPKSYQYQEGRDFIKTGQILGDGITGIVEVVKDMNTNREMALKTIKISEFQKEEIAALLDLNETWISPALYYFDMEGNRIRICMEIIENGVTLRNVIDYHMGNIRTKYPSLVKPFSTYVFYNLVSAVCTMNERGWTHNDLHAKNIMLQESPEGVIRTRILDFGRAKRLDSEDGYSGVRSDMVQVVRNFTALYVNQEFESQFDLRPNQEKWKEKLSEMANAYSLSQEDETEMLLLVDRALKVRSKHDVPELQKYCTLIFDINRCSRDVAEIVFAKPDSQKIYQEFNVDKMSPEYPNDTDLESELRKEKPFMGSTRPTE